MDLDLHIVFNVLLGIVLYKMVINVFVMTIVKIAFRTEAGNDVGSNIRKSFKERIQEIETKK